MKKLFTLKNCLLLGAAFIGLLFFGLSFATKLYFPAEGNLAFNNTIWGTSTVSYNGQTWPLAKVMEGMQRVDPLALPLIGVILILVAAIALCVAVFALKNEKIAKIVCLVAAGLLLLGGIFQFIVVPSFKTALYNSLIKMGASEAAATEEATHVAGYAQPGALSTISAVFSIVAGLAAGAAPFIPAKK